MCEKRHKYSVVSDKLFGKWHSSLYPIITLSDHVDNTCICNLINFSTFHVAIHSMEYELFRKTYITIAYIISKWKRMATKIISIIYHIMFMFKSITYHIVFMVMSMSQSRSWSCS